MLWSTAAFFCGFYAVGSIVHPGLGTLVALGLTVLAVRFAISGRQFNNEVLPGLMQKWVLSFMFNRCGALFVAALKNTPGALSWRAPGSDSRLIPRCLSVFSVV